MQLLSFARFSIVVVIICSLELAISALNHTGIELALALATRKINGSTISANRAIVNNFACNLVAFRDEEFHLRRNLDIHIIEWSNLVVQISN